jgi:hypothetical protein
VLPPYSPHRRDGFGFRFAAVLALAFAFTVWQVNMVQQRRADRAVGGSGGDGGGGPFGGLQGAGSDWGMVLGAVAARLELHSRWVEVVDGRTAGGEGARLLTLLARPGAVAAAAANESAVVGAWNGALGWRAPLVLCTLHEGRGGGGLAGPRRPRSFFGAGGGGGRRAGAAAADWDERGVPRGPRRGKAARAFGAHSGPSLDARTRSRAPPQLTLQLHVHVAGLTCALAGAAGEGGAPPPPAPLPPCEHTGEPLLPFSAPSSALAAKALAAAAQPSRSALAPAALDAPFLKWPEALLALLRDVQRLRLAELRAPGGAQVAPPCGGPRLPPCASERGAAPPAVEGRGQVAVAAAAEEEKEGEREEGGRGGSGEL